MSNDLGREPLTKPILCFAVMAITIAPFHEL
jgi:hypothetical protein